jgi:nucleoside phosphorylase
MSKRVLIISVIPVELSNLLESLSFDKSHRNVAGRKYYYWKTRLAEAREEPTELYACALGKAGNVNMAVFTANMISDINPDFAILLGIAAGYREKTKIGQVVLAEKVVHYEPAAVVPGADGPQLEPRPDMSNLDIGVLQMLTAYSADKQAVTRISDKGDFPRLDSLPSEFTQDPAVRKNIADEPLMNFAAVASGEKLLRDAGKIKSIRQLHGRIEAVEMEAAGFAEACDQDRLPYLVIRGVSDFGDEFKDDSFHQYASKRAVSVAIDFISFGLDFSILPNRESTPAVPSHASTAMEEPKDDRTALLGHYIDGDPARDLHAFKSDQARVQKTCVCAFISVSPTKAGPRDPSRCYHLGHAMAAQMFSEFRESIAPIELLITPSSNYWRPNDTGQNKANFEVLGNWYSAFDFQLEPTPIHRYIYNLDLDERLSRLQRQLENLWTFATNQIVGTVAAEILDWRYSGQLGAHAEQVIRDRFSRYDGFADGIELTDESVFDEFLAFLYIILAWPQWVSKDWIVKCTHSFTDPERSVAVRHFGKADLLILESRKNRVVWDALAFAARLVEEPIPFPPRIYFKTLKNTDLDDWMYSRNRANIVPLWGDVAATVSGLTDRFVEHALSLLQPALVADIGTGRKWLSEFAVTWGRRLRQQADA